MDTNYWRATTNNNWTVDANWSLGHKPTSAEPAAFDASSPNPSTLNIDATAVCAGLDFTGAPGTVAFTGSAGLTVSGNFTYKTGMTPTYSGLMTINAAATLTSNGVTHSGSMHLNAAGTAIYTLVGNWISTGIVTESTGVHVLNKTTDETFACNGGYTSTSAISGTATIILGGGTWSGSGVISNNLTINCTTLTISGTVTYGPGTLTYTAGTVTTTGSTFVIYAGMTFNANGIVFNTMTAGSGGTITLASDLSMVTLLPGYATPFSGAFNITCANLTSISGITIPNGQTLTVTSSLNLKSSASIIKSKIASSPCYLNYTGDPANCVISGFTFTDVDASGSSIPIDNWYGGTLTRCTNIANKTSADLARAADESKIITGQTVGQIAGSASSGKAEFKRSTL